MMKLRVRSKHRGLLGLSLTTINATVWVVVAVFFVCLWPIRLLFRIGNWGLR